MSLWYSGTKWLQNAAALRRHGSDQAVRALKLCRRTLDIQVGAPAEFQRPDGVIRAVAAQRCGILEPFRARASLFQYNKPILIRILFGF